jgi:hypothetical protein
VLAGIVVAAIGLLGCLIPVAFADSSAGWSAPISVSTNTTGETSDAPAVAVSSAGNIASIWLNTAAGITNLDTTVDDPGTPFSGVQGGSYDFADSISAGDSDQPQVAEDSSGDAIAVWLQNAANDGGNHGATDDAVVSGWEPPGVAGFGDGASPIDAAVAGVENTEPHVAFDASGDAIAVWAQKASGGSWSVNDAVAPDGSDGAFGSVQVLASGLPSDPQPDLAIGRSGTPAHGGDVVTVVWVAQGSGLYASSGEFDGGSLPTPTEIYADAHTLAQPVAAVDTNGDSAIAWVDNGTVYEDLLSFGDSEFLTSVPPDYITAGSGQSDPQIVVMPTVNNDPETAVSFYNATSGTTDVAAESGGNAADLNGWEDIPVQVETEVTAIPQPPQLSIQSDGAVTMLWETSTAVDAITSSTAPTVSDTPSFSGSPHVVASGLTIPSCDAESCDALASDNSGDLAAVWLQEDSDSNVQVAAACYYESTGSTGFDDDTCTPHAVVVSQSIALAPTAPGTVGGSESLSATGGGSGNPVVFTVDPSSSPSTACSVSGTNGATVNFAQAGSCVIDANQTGDAEYSAAPQVSQTIAVSAAATPATTPAPTTTTTTPPPTTAATTATTTPAATPSPTTTTTPAPVLGSSSDVAKTSGTVQVELPGTHTFVALGSATQIPFGAVINATSGTVTTTVALPNGQTSTSTFWAGEFTLSQARSGAITAELTGGSFTGCPSPPAASKAAHSASGRVSAGENRPKAKKATTKKPGTAVRSLWSNAKGNYTTSGKNGAAAVLGTEWLTRDQCNGTYFQVKSTSNDPHGEIRVTVYYPHRHTVLLRRGHSLLAPARGFS